MRFLPPLSLFLLATTLSFAQFSDSPVGQNRAEVDWEEFETTHFQVIYHTGLESYAREAANIAEAAYPVVTGNLGTQVSHRIPMYLSDLDQIPNAFARGDEYMHIWMRGLLDDQPLGGIRSAGRSKWLRSVITHELTHVVISHATSMTVQETLGFGTMPRWFHEGVARFMEPDGWTTDVDAVLRVAAVNGRLGYNVLRSGRLDGTLMYETGHSIVRYMVWRFGDKVIANILNGGRITDSFYDFELAVEQATGIPLSEIHSDWYRTVTALYGAEYVHHEEIAEVSPKVTGAFEVVSGAQYSPAKHRLALLAARPGGFTYLYMIDGQNLVGSPVDTSKALPFSSSIDSETGRVSRRDSSEKPSLISRANEQDFVLLSRETGFDERFSWNPDGSRLVLSKLRHGSHSALVHDLYILDVDNGSLDRLTSDASLSDPAWSPDGATIVAVEKRIGRDNLVLVNPRDGSRRRLTTFEDDTQIYTPSWSPDGTRIAFSMFDPEGNRVIATIGVDGAGLKRLTDDSVNNRYPLWSPDGTQIAFTSHAGGRPNLHVLDLAGGAPGQVTDLGGGIFGMQWIAGSDKILAISFDSRDEIVPHLIPASRRVTPSPAPPVRDRFTAWRNVSFPLQTPPLAKIPATQMLDSGGYSPLLDLTPVVTAIPTYATDRSRVGGHGSRFGIGTAWSDPMEIHTAIGYVDYGFDSEEPGAELLYFYRGLPMTLQFHLGYSLGFRGTMGDIPYFQRDRTVAISASYDLPDPTTFGIGSIAGVGVRRRILEPYNNEEFDREALPDQLIPEKVTLSELLAFYQFSSPQTLWRGEIVRSEPGLGSDREYTRASFKYSWASRTVTVVFFGAPRLLFNFDAAAHFGPQVAQEALAFQKYDHFQNGFSIPNLVGLSSNQTNYRPRGSRVFQQGEYLYVASFGLAWDPDWIGSLLPIVGFLDPDFVVYVEIGDVIANDARFSGDHDRNTTVGIEFRTSLMQNYWLAFGTSIGASTYEWNKLHNGGGAYLRLSMGR